jgi:hypothetical protein
VSERWDLAAPIRVFQRKRIVRLGSGNVFSNNKVARRSSKESCMIVHISGIWMVSITLFDLGLKARCVSAGHEELHLGMTSILLLLPFCDYVTVSPLCDRVVMGTLPEDVPLVGAGAFKARHWKVSV